MFTIRGNDGACVRETFLVSSKDYNLNEELGEGVSTTVYWAICISLTEIAAIEALRSLSFLCYLREVLKALICLHAYGHIHRDVKTGKCLEVT